MADAGVILASYSCLYQPVTRLTQGRLRGFMMEIDDKADDEMRYLSMASRMEARSLFTLLRHSWMASALRLCICSGERDWS